MSQTTHKGVKISSAKSNVNSQIWFAPNLKNQFTCTATLVQLFVISLFHLSLFPFWTLEDKRMFANVGNLLLFFVQASPRISVIVR